MAAIVDRNTPTATQFNFTQSEIGEFDMAGGRHQHIVRFDVTMNDTVFVQILQRHRYLGAIESGDRFIEKAIFNQP